MAVEGSKIDLGLDKEKTTGGKIDYFFNKILPKKFLVWFVATLIVFTIKEPDGTHWMSGDMWGYITLVYMGANAVKGFVTNGTFRKKRHGRYTDDER